MKVYFFKEIIPSRVQVPSKRKSYQLKQYRCGICKESFPNRENLLEHKQTHYVEVTTIECDICGRLIKGGSDHYLLLHKFSHKNEEEKRAAVAANERGSYGALVSSKVKKPRKSKKPRVVPHPPTLSTSGAFSNKNICPICDRVFPRKCYLASHMRVHIGEKWWPDMSPNLDETSRVDLEPPALHPQQAPVRTYPAQRRIGIVRSASNNEVVENIFEPNLDELTKMCNAIGNASFDPSMEEQPAF